MKKAVFIFDFDGTIADTHHFLIRIYNELASEYGYRVIRPDEVSMLKDRSGAEIIRFLKIPILKIPALIARAKKEFRKGIHNVKPIDGIAPVLKRLKASENLIGIFSSNASENINRFLNHNDLDIFDFIHTTTNVLAKNISLHKLIANNGWSADHILYVGDEIRDIIAAQRLGLKCGAVTWGYNSDKALRAYNPDYIFQHPDDLLNLTSLFSIP